MSTTDVTDYGTDIAGHAWLGNPWGLASGLTNLANALLCRLTTPLGTLDDHPGYGYDVRDLLLSDLSPAELDAARSAIEAQLEDDDRVLSAKATLALDISTGVLTMDLDIEGADGPFSLVLAVSQVSAEVLSINGVATASTTDATVTPIIVTLQGPPGRDGAAGTSGGGGGGGGNELSLQGDGPYADSSGSEVYLEQEPRDFGVLSGTVSLEITCLAKVLSAGTATIRVRIGGTVGNLDGAVQATLTTTATSYASISATNTFANPTGLQLVTVSVQSPSGIEADVAGVYVTLR